jgi:hypothetical protein
MTDSRWTVRGVDEAVTRRIRVLAIYRNVQTHVLVQEALLDLLEKYDAQNVKVVIDGVEH